MGIRQREGPEAVRRRLKQVEEAEDGLYRMVQAFARKSVCLCGPASAGSPFSSVLASA